jgi:multidrug efflux pump subunit AcrA (membrane-fusion protein)
LGQNLFEIGPLDRLLIEVLVPESDIRFVAAEQSVQIKFAAYPFRTWEGTITRVHPRSEVIEQQNVFVAEVEIENRAGELQPGMKGTAKVRRGWAPLGWLLFRGAWDDFRYWWVW